MVKPYYAKKGLPSVTKVTQDRKTVVSYFGWPKLTHEFLTWERKPENQYASMRKTTCCTDIVRCGRHTQRHKSALRKPRAGSS